MSLIDTARFLPGPVSRACYRPLQPVVERALGFRGLERRYRDLPERGRSPAEFARIGMRELGLSWEISQSDQAELAAIDGPMVVCANHPSGPVEPLALMDLMEGVRPGDWCVLANRILGSIPELRDALIPVEPLHGRNGGDNGVRGFGRAVRHLRRGGVLVTFPAGRVSGWSRDLRAVCDRSWSAHPLRLARLTHASVVCLHVEGRAGDLFLSIPNRWSHLRALLLARELAHPFSRNLKIRLAERLAPEAVAALAAGPRPAARLRAFCYLGADRALAGPAPAPPTASVPADSSPADVNRVEALREEVDRIRESGRERARRAPYSVLLIRGDESPRLLEEIGRQREITFRAAGQGTGREIDLSPEDTYYHHLVLWDSEENRLAGAYRIGFTEEIRRERGKQALYLQPLFRFPETFYRRIGPAMELSRSFVIPSRQRDGRALALLWHGLAAAASERGCRTCYGCVTISNLFHPASRAILVDFLKRNYADRAELRKQVRAVNPFRPGTRYHRLATDAFAGEKVDALRPMIERMEGGHRSIPPLIRYYCSLGARYLSFHVEPAFRDAIYCLLRVDLRAIEDRYKKRFGADE